MSNIFYKQTQISWPILEGREINGKKMKKKKKKQHKINENNVTSTINAFIYYYTNVYPRNYNN